MNDQTVSAIDYQHSPSMLLVDDESSVLSALRRLFRKLDCEVIIANSGQEGLEKLEENTVDLIISDARMPNMTGPEFLAIVAEKYPETERILLTGYADMQATIDAVNLGRISHYVDKPWDDEKLIELVERSLSLMDLKKHNTYLQDLIKQQNEQLKQVNESLEEKVKERTSQLEHSHENLQKMYRYTIDLFSSLLDTKGMSQHDQKTDIIQLVKFIGEKLNIEKKEQSVLYYATKLRYIGLLSLSDDLLTIPIDQLTNAQRQQYEQYPLVGSTLLMGIPPLKKAAAIIAQHKEYLNGKGFPNKDFGNQLSLVSQVLIVANEYIELVNGRMRSESLSSNEALGYIESRSGEYYDADVVEALKVTLADNIEAGQSNEIRVWSKQLVSGMVLSRDLVNTSDMLLLAKGAVLDDDLIQKLMNLEEKNAEELNFYVLEPDNVIEEKCS